MTQLELLFVRCDRAATGPHATADTCGTVHVAIPFSAESECDDGDDDDGDDDDDSDDGDDDDDDDDTTTTTTMTTMTTTR